MSGDRTPFDAAWFRERFEYDPASGNFTNRRTGKPVGHLSDRGYVKVRVGALEYSAHRLAWLHVTGEWPTEQIDHRNHDRADNRWINLRLATTRLNCANRRRRGEWLGVRREWRGWRARIGYNYGHIELGLFSTPEDAARAYDAAAIRLNGEFASLNFPVREAA